MLQAVAFFLLLLLRITNGWYLAPPVHSVAEAECDQAPDALSQPFEYRTISQYRTFGREGSKMEPCVLITQLSVERLHRLEVQARAWGGPISAAIYVPTRNGTSSMVEKVRQFSERMSNDSTYAGWMSLSILFGHEDSPWRYKCSNSTSRVLLYPINALRNLAVTASSGSKGSSFPLFFLLDVDFTPSKGLRGWIQAETKIGLVKRCKKGDMIVVPAFESNTTDASPTIEWALQGYNDKTVVPFHSDHFRHGHGSTNYDMWRQLSIEALETQTRPKTYHLQETHDGYEPYVIVAREFFVPYDERFRGYGKNKIVQLKWMASRGARYHVLSGFFVVEEQHAVGFMFRYLMDSHRYSLVHKLYRSCVLEMRRGQMPQVSHTTLQLFKESGIH